MTATLEREALEQEPLPTPDAPPPDLIDEGPRHVELRPLLVAGLSSLALALTAGGIFGSWAARLLASGAAGFGVFWAWIALRSPRRRTAYQALLPAVALGLGIVSVSLAGHGGAGNLPALVREAVRSGRLLRPPIPFDAGWRPIIIVLMAMVAYASAMVGALLDRPRLALVIPLPLVGLTAISQPKDGQFLAGILAVVPVIAALTVVFGSDLRNTAELSRQFELRRVVRAGAALVPTIAVLIALNSSSLLFPKPAYDPAQKAQKPKAVPLSAAQDRVLFEVSGQVTGPWKLGSLDVYDGKAWKLPPYNPKKLQKVGGDGVIDKTRNGSVTIAFTVRDIGTSAVLPGVVGPTKIDVTSAKPLFDPRAGVFRMESGRVPAGLSYKMSMPSYPTPEQLRDAPPLHTKLDKDLTDISAPPPAVRDLLNQAPSGSWDRLDFLLKKLSAVEVAVGTGTPVDVPPSKVQQILAGNHEGSPYELVAAQAMLARWAGVPSRIGFGFDGEQKEGDVLTVRPRNAAQWLEVYFEHHGWIPIITAPPKAKASLDNDKNTKFNPTITAGSDVDVEIYIPVKVKSLRLLYQRVRDVLFALLPFIAAALAAYLALPWMQKAWRRAKRRQWAAQHGPAEQIAIEYCEFRDAATDLGLGDPYATPIEFLDHLVEDDEHEEFAWLVTKALYGDLVDNCTADDVAAAREMAASLRRRLARAQPAQTRALAQLTRLSLQQPYSVEVPSVRTLRLKPAAV